MHVYAGCAGNKVELKERRVIQEPPSKLSTQPPSLMLPSLGLGTGNSPHSGRNVPMIFPVWLLWERKINTTPHGAPDLTLQVIGTMNVGTVGWNFPMGFFYFIVQTGPVSGLQCPLCHPTWQGVLLFCPWSLLRFQTNCCELFSCHE